MFKFIILLTKWVLYLFYFIIYKTQVKNDLIVRVSFERNKNTMQLRIEETTSGLCQLTSIISRPVLVYQKYIPYLISASIYRSCKWFINSVNLPIPQNMTPQYCILDLIKLWRKEKKLKSHICSFLIRKKYKKTC